MYGLKRIFHNLPLHLPNGLTNEPRGLGWIIIDSLDPMTLMNRTSRLGNAQTFDPIKSHTTSRILGRVSYVSSPQDSVYLSNAIDLADRLLDAYEFPSGIPYAGIELRTKNGIRSHADGGASSMTEVTTLQLEMKYLANFTGNELYWLKAEKVDQILDDNVMGDGLHPIFVDPESDDHFTTPTDIMGRIYYTTISTNI
ncbi:alpha-mannosidase [Paracoccidioides lutzii Pb01]|uniref:mannosyl-oligosaccharide 1,2-alpha-mannosidase n=1 Tax=Paracoccidioides lutzii (strain ATCC MYA-826 / Pb01) TaxID=502779 RepID=C1GPU8_PARBA|nr:alpha-mannosidase [Paracoccidioides lutzii Pb01]EEH36220.1 alpha-mannosidase [Paracoccidioides lutzii Pb01]